MSAEAEFRERFVLEFICEHDGCLVSAIAKTLFSRFAHSTAKQYTWQALNSLEKKGKAKRVRVSMGNVIADVWRAA